MARRSPQRATRGVATRVVSMLLGAFMALGGLVAMQVPLLHRPATVTSTWRAIDPPAAAGRLVWPSTGSAALVIPSLGVSRTWHSQVEPIASLAKMMTAYLTLEKFPLALGQDGPCISVSASDVARYQEIKATGGSNVAVSLGESLCELQLLEGLLVHSANNFATLLANMVSGDSANFVALMNETASSLGLEHTRYADESGYMDGSVSTALEQAHLAMLLMRSPVVRSIVQLPSVTLPVAGTVGSYTPLVGTDHVIGVKSGRTDAAGGCDVMAMDFNQGATTRVLYAVVLGQRGGDLLGPAGQAALSLADSALRLQRHLALAKGAQVATIGWGRDVVPVRTARAEQLWWWSPTTAPVVTMQVGRFITRVRRGQVVGYLSVRARTTRRIALVAAGSESAPSLWQRLR